MNMKRTLALLLAALMLAPAIAGCDKDVPDTPDTPDTPVSDTTPEDTTPEETGLVLGKTDFNGNKLRILGISEAYNYGYYATADIWVESEQADPFERAVYQRVQDCMDKYNFGIEYYASAGPADETASLVSGGIDQYDLMFSMWSGAWKISKSGNLIDLREVPTLDLDNSWWDQNANEQLDIANRMFYTTGDITTTDDRCCRFLYFNKTLAAANNMESPYDLVKDNKWTFDKFAQMCRDVYDDVNGDGQTDEDDVVGFFYEDGQLHYFMAGLNEHYASVGDDGMPTYTFLDTPDSVTKMEAVAGLMIDDKVVFNVNDYTTLNGYSNKFTYARSKFAAGKHLFTLGGAQVISEFADMEDAFGILPLPKWNEDQNNYYHSSSGPMVGIPNTKTDTADIGYMMEYLAYEGQKTLIPEYKEKMLKRRYAQDTQSGDMLDIIHASKCFDLGFVANWNNILNVANNSIKTGRIPQLSAFNRTSKSIPKLIEREYNAMLNVGNE